MQHRMTKACTESHADVPLQNQYWHETADFYTEFIHWICSARCPWASGCALPRSTLDPSNEDIHAHTKWQLYSDWQITHFAHPVHTFHEWLQFAQKSYSSGFGICMCKLFFSRVGDFPCTTTVGKALRPAHTGPFSSRGARAQRALRVLPE